LSDINCNLTPPTENQLKLEALVAHSLFGITEGVYRIISIKKIDFIPYKNHFFETRSSFTAQGGNELVTFLSPKYLGL
jgi:hypothetical protein